MHLEKKIKKLLYGSVHLVLERSQADRVFEVSLSVWTSYLL